MVVFGAGASFDSAPALPARSSSFDDRPPLAANLFDPRLRANLDIIERFSACKPILPDLMGGRSESVEETLQRLRVESDDHPLRLTQLAAIAHYLRWMLWNRTDMWNSRIGGITNYRTLLDDILFWLRGRSDPVALVTFNYDRLIEDAVASFQKPIVELSDYVDHSPFKIFKLHGSVHWARKLKNRILNQEAMDHGQLARAMIEEAQSISLSDEYVISNSVHENKAGDVACFPAIAIPVMTKHVFECPPNHLETLRQAAARVCDMVVIGWRGMEEHFLALLAERLKLLLRGLVVDANKDEAVKLCVRMKEKIGGTWEPFEGDFTGFVLTHSIRPWLVASKSA